MFINLTEVFDMVDYYLFEDKLGAIGLYKHYSLWFNSYLHYWCKCVPFLDSQSDVMIMAKGVPQGPSLGPLLFSVFINDLSQICSDYHIQFYADDTVIYSSLAGRFWCC